TPGPAAINSATYIGYHIAGFRGSLATTIAVCTPSFTIIYAISLYFDNFLKISIVKSAFAGIQVCVVYLILSAAVQMFKESRKTLFNMAILIIVLITMLLFSILSVGFSTVSYILICGVIGTIGHVMKSLSQKKGRKK
ncbi:MAG: chromate transporter, partial [Lachnospiraceae bacterium]|nr:chromate transporter [Lachnospiraceae bacterium]